MPIRRSVPLLALTLVAGCAASPVSTVNVAAIEVSASRCFGDCPAYSYTMSSRGDLLLDVPGDVASAEKVRVAVAPRVTRRAFARLRPWRARAGAANPFPCEDRITDQPTYQVRWILEDGRVETLRHDRGCLSRPGRAFSDAVESLPETLGIADRIQGSGR